MVKAEFVVEFYLTIADTYKAKKGVCPRLLRLIETRCFIISSMNQVSHSSTLNQSANTGNSQPLPDVDGFTI